MSSYYLCSLEREVSTLRAENKRLHERVEVQTHDVRALETAIAIQNDAYGRQGQKLEAAQADARAARETVKALTERCAAAEDVVAEQTAQIAAQGLLDEQRQAQIAAQAEKIAELMERNETRGERVRDLTREVEDLLREVAELTERNRVQVEIVEAEQATARDAQRTVETLHDVLDRLGASITIASTDGCCGGGSCR